jgi:hypothetical protein
MEDPEARYDCSGSSVVERFLGKEEVPGSSPGQSSPALGRWGSRLNLTSD